MSRNYYGEKAQYDYTVDFLTEDMYECFNDGCSYSDEDKNEMLSTPCKYFIRRYKDEYDCNNVRKSNLSLTDRIADYLSKLPFTNIAFETYEQLELKKEWGYKTNDDIWSENFFNHIAGNIIKWCKKSGIDLYRELL